MRVNFKSLIRLVPEKVLWNIPGSICLIFCVYQMWNCLPYFANQSAAQKIATEKIRLLTSGNDTSATVELINWHSRWYSDTIKIKRWQLNNIVIGHLAKTNDSLRKVADMPNRMPLLRKIDSLQKLTKKQSETIKAFINL